MYSYTVINAYGRYSYFGIAQGHIFLHCLWRLYYKSIVFVLIDILSSIHDVYIIKLRMEMGNMSKRQQPDQRADNSRRPPLVDFGFKLAVSNCECSQLDTWCLTCFIFYVVVFAFYRSDERRGFQLILTACSYVVVLHHCPRLELGVRMYMVNSAIFRMCLSIVRSLKFSCCVSCLFFVCCFVNKSGSWVSRV